MTVLGVDQGVQGDPRWALVLARARDDSFVYAVSTTGVYCRPYCSSRRPRPHNVEFFDGPLQARAAGYRPCKRCRPDEADPEVAIIARACRLLDEGAVCRLDELATATGLSASRLHRRFKAVVGLTPAAYAAARRGEVVRATLRGHGTVTDAVYAAGYGSSSRFYERSDALLGMTPTAFKRHGEGERIRFAVGLCSLGSVLVAATDKGVCSILLGDDPEALVHELDRSFRQARLEGGDGSFERLVATVVGLIEHPGTGSELPLDIRGTAFQRRIWAAIARIPAGTTATYADLARSLGRPTAARAVANACGANALAVAIPCHRVVRTDGGLGGYRWGLVRKQALLLREQAVQDEVSPAADRPR
jgi:AraC family transcriptional regulator of adaptative response/methylated-DNA-[protein]-cysteine methyltransferase